MKLLSFLVPCAVAGVAVAEPASDLLYANNADAGVIKTFTPATSATGTRYLQNAQGISGLAANDAAQRLYVSFGSGGSISLPDNNLYTYDYSGNLLSSVRMSNTSLGGTGGGVSMNGLTYANSTLYGVHQNGSTAAGGVYSIDPSTGALTLAASLNNGSTLYNFQDIDYDELNGRFIGVNSTVTGSPGSPSGLYSIVLPSTTGGFATVTSLAALPSDAPTGNATPDGLAYDDASGIVYLTYNRSTVISRYNLTTGTYLSSLTVPAQTQGASGDATFASGYVGAVPEPSMLAILPLAAAALFRRRSK